MKEKHTPIIVKMKFILIIMVLLPLTQGLFGKKGGKKSEGGGTDKKEERKAERKSKNDEIEYELAINQMEDENASKEDQMKFKQQWEEDHKSIEPTSTTTAKPKKKKKKNSKVVGAGKTAARIHGIPL